MRGQKFTYSCGRNSPAGSENMISSAIASIEDKYWTFGEI
jgi:hypothetical protein